MVLRPPARTDHERHPDDVIATTAACRGGHRDVPNARKIFVEGSRPDIRCDARGVPDPTVTNAGLEPNPRCMSTHRASRPDVRSTDRAAEVRTAGSRAWRHRGPPGPSSASRDRRRPGSRHLRFATCARRARGSPPHVTQMHTPDGHRHPEMEFVAIRETSGSTCCALTALRQAAAPARGEHSARISGSYPPEFVRAESRPAGDHPLQRQPPELEPMVIGRNFRVKSTPTSATRRRLLDRRGGEKMAWSARWGGDT